MNFVKLSPYHKSKFSKLNKTRNLLINRLVTCNLSDFDKVQDELYKVNDELEKLLSPFGLDLKTRHLVK